MKQKHFETEHAPLWQQVETSLANSKHPDEHFPALYRQLCQHLALASQRGYSPALTDYLQRLVHEGHQSLYGVAVERPLVLRQWLTATFPQRVRQEWRLLVLALLAFFGIALITGLLVWFQPTWAYSFASPSDLNHYRSMYQPANLADGRGGSGGDVAMFGFYIWNNVSIGFRTFAAGIFAGVPSLLSLGSNGMHFGVIASWLSMDEATRTPFWSFVVTHSSFEVAGLLLSAVAGMRLGFSLVNPGRMTRRHALQAASARMFPVIVGAALLTVLAAFFEGFWSASPRFSPETKYFVGAICWSMIILYFALVGRGRDDAAG